MNYLGANQCTTTTLSSHTIPNQRITIHITYCCRFNLRTKMIQKTLLNQEAKVKTRADDPSYDQFLVPTT